MKSVLLIDLGRFGRHMAQKLKDLHHEVLAVDKDEKRVNNALPYVTNAQIGDDFQSSLETTALLKEQVLPSFSPGPPGTSTPNSRFETVRTT